ncbi:T9SS type A sorting domain-containing protein [Porphyromonas gingivalis]|uniref:T9SS type A sorting domain-containing protein n=1 Tax=Porphyromonas gingivalis TaxID=837 RepID=UPI000C185861|nr:T9SS type A sorting domain-containing protein [Porphyromonas gingivalis]ATR92149.1 peptidase [Porphyromonas gingivalis]ATS09004.1 peptidase [Porphyromonas gingivalis]
MNKFYKSLLQSGLAAFVSMATALTASAQISFGGEPLSFSSRSTETHSFDDAMTIRLTPDFNPEDLIAQSRWQSQRDGRPVRIGQVIPVDVDFASKASLISSIGDVDVYRLQFKLEGAKAITLYYDSFNIPEGGRLYIYTPDHEIVLGAYTNATHRRNGAFATEPVPGSELIMDYEVSRGGTLPDIKISGAGYIFDKVGGRPVTDNHYGIGEDDSDSDCEININCPEGADWQAEKNGVVQMIMVKGQYISMCSGNLLNNTKGDFTPLIISAGHCASLTTNFGVTQSELDKWIFTFHYEKRGCSNGTLAIFRGNSIIGASMKAFLPIKGKSDGLLLQLNDEVPLRYRVYYNGWDSTPDIPSSGAGIHHPAGDAMKISILKKTPTLNTWISSSGSGGTDDHFYFKYDQGGTEGGSSGSSLFNQNKHVVGTLTGGAGNCGGTEFYGRLNSHWNEYASDGNTSRMDIYLDPQNNGQTTVLNGTYRDGYKPLPSVPRLLLQSTGDQVELNWTAVPADQYPSSYQVEYHIFRNGKEIATTKELSYSDPIDESIIGSGIIRYEVSARFIYPSPLDGVESYKDTDKTSADLAIGDIQTKLKPDVTPLPGGGVSLSWKVPFLSQLVSRFGESPNPVFKTFEVPYVSAAAAQTPNPPVGVVIADKFMAGTYPEKAAIAAVYVMPSAPDSTFHLFLKSNTNRRLQKVTTPSDWQAGTWLRINLDKPFPVNNDHMLFAGIRMPNKYKLNRAIRYVRNPDNLFSITGKKISYNNGVSFEGYGIPSLLGYMAIKYLVVNTDAPKIDMSLVQEPYAKGTNVAPFPELVSIYVYKNGTFIGTQDPSVTTYSVSDGTESDEYEIKLVYKGSGISNGVAQIENNNAVVAYPSVVTDRFSIKNAHMVHAAALYSLDGKQVRSWNNLRNGVTFSVQGLTAGTYMLVMQTANGPVSQKIVKQ